jgi:hypothetical protein
VHFLWAAASEELTAALNQLTQIPGWIFSNTKHTLKTIGLVRLSAVVELVL